jgi:hypothetical protein
VTTRRSSGLCHGPRCRKPLGESPSDDFCSIDCQEAWHQQFGEPLVWSADVIPSMRALVTGGMIAGPVWPESLTVADVQAELEAAVKGAVRRPWWRRAASWATRRFGG